MHPVVPCERPRPKVGDNEVMRAIALCPEGIIASAGRRLDDLDAEAAELIGIDDVDRNTVSGPAAAPRDTGVDAAEAMMNSL